MMMVMVTLTTMMMTTTTRMMVVPLALLTAWQTTKARARLSASLIGTLLSFNGFEVGQHDLNFAFTIPGKVSEVVQCSVNISYEFLMNFF